MLPKEILTQSVGSLQAANQPPTNLLYLVVISSVVALLIALPMIKVELTVQSPAVVRPSTDKTTISSLVSGIVDKSFVIDNAYVKRLDTLYIIDNEILVKHDNLLRQRALEVTQLLDDIEALKIFLRRPIAELSLKTSYYEQSLLQFEQKHTNALIEFQKAKSEHDRSMKLHIQKVIADAEFEHTEFQLNKEQLEISTLTENLLGQLASDELVYSKEFNDIQFKRSELLKESEAYVIRAPCSGTITATGGVYKGSTITASTALADISPDTGLITEVYVSPNDIGLLYTNMNVVFQIDAFNYNQWGFASGQILEISNDATVIRTVPAFKVKCSISSDYLQLRNGYKGFLKKGMTASARFIVAERSIWALLFDKVDNWINPRIKAQ